MKYLFDFFAKPYEQRPIKAFQFRAEPDQIADNGDALREKGQPIIALWPNGKGYSLYQPGYPPQEIKLMQFVVDMGTGTLMIVDEKVFLTKYREVED